MAKAKKRARDTQVMLTVYLEPEAHAGLAQLSVDTGASMSFYVRKAIDQLLAERGIKTAKGRK